MLLELLAISYQENNIKIGINTVQGCLHPKVRCFEKLKYNFSRKSCKGQRDKGS